MPDPALLALGSALCYGFVDFAGGLLARRAEFAAVAFAGQVGGFVFMLGVALLFTTADPSMPDLGWGAVSGLGTAVGMVFLYRGLIGGAMSIVVPISAVGSVTVPVLVGMTLLGERPSVPGLAGIGLAVIALGAVSRSGAGDAEGAKSSVRDALIASAGFAVQYLALAQAAPEAGLWPVVASRLAATSAILPIVIRRGNGVRLPWRFAVGSAVNGCFAALSLVLYLLATRQGLTTIAVVLASFYPVVPVVLGIVALRERPGPVRSAGLVLAAAAVVLLGYG
ncbi:EamA family transporter [Amycolatopsis japonica]|uniref:DMT family transporter n=1 Tax=Amycolatopsis japonica TaxID=208439 RepID=UPI00332C7D16